MEETQHLRTHLDHLLLKVGAAVCMLAHLTLTHTLEEDLVVQEKEHTQDNQTHLHKDKDILDITLAALGRRAVAVPVLRAEIAQLVPVDGMLLAVLVVLEFNFQTLLVL